MKNEFSYYSTISSITWPVVINPAHLLLCGLHAHTHCDSISHRTYPAALPHTYSHNLKCLGISSSPLRTSSFSHSLLYPSFYQNRTLSPPTISATSPTSSSGKTQWSTTVAGWCFPAQGESARTTSAAGSSWRTRGPPL